MIVLVVALGAYGFFSHNKESFTSDTIFLKLNMPLGGESAKSIGVQNNEDSSKNYKVSFNNLNGLVSTQDIEFILQSDEEKSINIEFKDEKNKVGVFLGLLKIETDALKQEIPLMVTIEDKKSVFAISHSTIPMYDNVYPGGKLGVNVKIYNLEDNELHKVKAKHSIKNFDDEVVLNIDEEDWFISEGRSESTKIVNIPEDLPVGDYVLVTSITENNIKTESGYLFLVSKKGDDVFSPEIKFFIIVILVFIVGVLVLFFYFVKTRDDLLIQLKKQQNRELQQNIEAIKCSRRDLSKIKNIPERHRKIVQLSRAKTKVIKKIKEKQKTQRKVFKKLRKKKKKGAVQQKIKEWNRQGYRMVEAEKEVKKIPKTNIHKHVKNLSAKGYSTSFLNK